jgi:tetratricopeptide (TPR) repeat protein
MSGKHLTFFLFLLAFLLPQSFLMGEAVTPHPQKSVEEILKFFDEKRRLVEPLVLSQDAVRAKPGVVFSDKMHTYAFRGNPEELYNYTFLGPGQQDSLYSIGLFKNKKLVFNAVFREGKMTEYRWDGGLISWYSDTLKPWEYYEVKDGMHDYRKVIWDSDGKISVDKYSATGDVPTLEPDKEPSPEEREKRKKALDEKFAKALAALPSRDEAIVQLRKEMAEHPNDPDNFFKEFEIACRYLYKLDSSRGEKRDPQKAMEIILHCFTAYPQHANNVEMFQLKIYLAEIYRGSDENDKAIETCWSIINADPKFIVVYHPHAGLKTGEEAQGQIDIVREAAMQMLSGMVRRNKGGTTAVKALLAQRPDDKLFQTTVQRCLVGYAQSAELSAKQDKEEEDRIRSIMAAETSKTLPTTTSLPAKAIKP